jgi:serine/threonine protein kinase/streptogramin lyase
VSSDSRVGSEFAAYRIEAVLGRGGMGVVYLAEDPRLGRKVALKLLPPELAVDTKFRERFIRESQIAARLEHPNILPVYEAGEADGQLFIAMRYVRGADLGSMVAAEGPLDAARAVSIVSDVGAALDEAHREGLIHRDVKPANILLAPSRGPGSPERAYLTDFGVTRRTTSQSGLTKTGQFMGTADYAAPEQIEGKTADTRADVYSLGCVLYHCLAGEPPFARDSEVATMYAHLKDRPPKPSAKRPDLPRGLDSVVATSMAKPPGQRFQSAGDLAQAARVAVRGITAAPRIRRPRLRALVAGGVAGAVLAAGAIALLVSRSNDTPKPPAATDSSNAPPRGLIRVDPASADVTGGLSVLPVGDPAAAFGEGFLWMMSGNGLLKINGQGVQLGEPIGGTVPPGCGGVFACPVAISAGEGSLWVLYAGIGGLGGTAIDSHLLRVDPATNRVEEFLVPSVNIGGAFSVPPLATGEGWIWAIDRNPPALVRIEPGAPDHQERFPLPSPGDGITVGSGSVWVRHNTGTESSVSRVDPRTGTVLDETVLPGSADGLAVGGGNVWISDSSNDELVRIDPLTGSIAAHFEVGRAPRGVLVDGEGGLWVNLTGEGEGGVLAKVDPTVGTVVARIPLRAVDPPVRQRQASLVFGFDSVWVA